jgi:heme exporter protein A
MNNYSLSLHNVTKIFGRRLVFKDINFELSSGNVYGISGRNGSGKSTLAKIILYDEFSADENLYHFAKIRNAKVNKNRTDELFKLFGLSDRRSDLLKGYSSGMKQRMKFIFALQHSPKIILLDEPTSNLDNAGKEAVYKLIKDEAENNLVIIASNEESDLELCSNLIDVEKFKAV